ncbi:MAG: helix-turn-helix transcriptional regulator [Terrimicrobiaceae bacterium]|nr:helix-turn-helix transcriptional regulator [Terrimicrobiaceae bacterium]
MPQLYDMPYSAKRVRDLREKLGWNQTELAYRAGVGTTVISNFENYKRQTPGMAKKIARALKVRITDLWVSEAEGMNGNGAEPKAKSSNGKRRG